MNWSRFVTAFLVAPAGPAVLFTVPGLFLGGSGVVGVFLITCLVTYTHAAVLGAPVAWFLARKNSLTLWRVVGASFLVGAVPFAGLNFYIETTMPPGAGATSNGVVMRQDGRLTNAGLRSAALSVIQCGLLGAATGLIWWFIAKPRTGRRTAT